MEFQLFGTHHGMAIFKIPIKVFILNAMADGHHDAWRLPISEQCYFEYSSEVNHVLVNKAFISHSQI